MKDRELEIKLTGSPEIQAKFDSEVSSGNIRYFISIFSQFEGWSIEYAGVKSVSDEYWDSPNLDLHHMSCSFRLRYTDRKMSIDIKRPKGLPRKDGVFDREEISIPLEGETRNTCFSDKFSSVRKEYLKEVAQTDFRLVFRVQNTRKVLMLQKGDALIEVSVDSFNYTNLATGFASKLCGELEMEAKSDAGAECLEEFASTLVKTNGFRPSSLSKYSRGVYELRLDTPPKLVQFTSWLQSPRGIFVGFLLVLLGILIGAASVALALK